VDRRLAEFDRSQIVLTPVAKDLVHDFALDLPVALTERFWEIMEKMRTSSSLMVELGERAGTSVRYGRSKDATSLFMDEANRIASEQKISLTEAMEQTARNNAALYDQYRSDTYAFKE
jgi:t-SNARE complex subunit (syntaxin)